MQEIESDNRAGKTRGIFKKIREIKIGVLKSGKGKDLTEETQMKVKMEGLCTPKLDTNEIAKCWPLSNIENMSKNQ